MSSDTIETQVAIVGGGPVGISLAIDLGQRGIDCVVVERYPEPQPVPKGQNLTQRTGEHFKAWGCSKAIRDASPIPHKYGVAGMMSYGTLLSDYHYDWLRRSDVRQFYAADNERLPQYETENVLRRRVAELGRVRTLYGWAGEAVTQDDMGAMVSIAEHGGSARQTVRAQYVVGCDGSRSTVRDGVGMTQDIDPHDKRMVLLVFNSSELHDLLERYPGKSYYNVLKPELDGYWLFFGRVELGKSWFFHAPVPAGATRENFDFIAYLHEAVGAEFAVELDYVGFWDLRIAVAKNYRKGRVFIAGDAAHSHPPYGGYGINTGFEDARNLGWKLAAALQGWAGSELLDSYSAERRPVFVSTAEDFIGRMIREGREFLATFDPAKDRAAFEEAWAARRESGKGDVANFVPNYEGSRIVFGPEDGVCSALGTHELRARAGHHLTPCTLSNGRNVFEVLDNGFALLAFDTGTDTIQAFSSAAAKAGAPLKIIEDSSSEVRDAYQAKQVLVRPDHFVAWAGEATPDGAQRIVMRSIGSVPG